MKINPHKHGWESRYYSILFGTDNIQHICHSYVESMEWCYYYYSNGCCDKTWNYSYHYGPLLSDLVLHLPTYQSKLQPIICKKPNISELCLLCYVTPKVNLQKLTPPLVSSVLLKTRLEWYQDEWDIEYSFCTYTWESHAVMSKIDIQDLERILSEIECSTNPVMA